MAVMESEYEGFEPPPGTLPLSSTIEIKVGRPPPPLFPTSPTVPNAPNTPNAPTASIPNLPTTTTTPTVATLPLPPTFPSSPPPMFKRLKRQFFPGMPESSVVLACLSRNNKFEPDAYGDWMAIMSRVPQVVLVVMAEQVSQGSRLYHTPSTISNPNPNVNPNPNPNPDQEEARDLLKQEAAARGVSPTRIFFAPKGESPSIR